MFGKIMSVSDDLMWRYLLLLTDAAEDDIARRQAAVAAGEVHPKQVKMQLAARIVADFHGQAAAEAAVEAFDARFSRGELNAAELEVIEVRVADASIGLPKLVVAAGLAASASEASRKIQQGGVRVDRERVTDIRTRVPAGGMVLLEVGRRAVNVQLVSAPGA
jgi:tyrosyl-tRNA synthetase